ncbi:hypothetical protein [Vibrio phage Va2]|nr:hypothetical protein [Vibrio phage Va2]
MSYNEKDFLKFIVNLNERFQYVRDDKQYGFKEVWTLLSSKNFKGDCEDYALTIWNEFGGEMYYVHYYGQGHAVLKLPCGRYIDNIYRTRVSKEYLEKRGYKFKRKYYLPIIWAKLFLGYVKKTYNDFKK